MESGTLELSSGRWKWQLISTGGRTAPAIVGLRESAMGDAEPRAETGAGEPASGPLLELEDPEEPRARMSRELPPGAEPEDEEEVRRLARDPDLRTVVDENGEVWALTLVERPEPATREEAEFDRPGRTVRYAREGEPERVGRLPQGRAFGEATRDELLEIVER